MARRTIRTRAGAATAVIALALTMTACGDDEPEVFTTINAASDGSGDAELEGSVVISDDVARLCEALLESFPPQCGEPSVVIANPDALDAELTTEQGVSWSDLPVRVVGTVESGVLTIEG